MKLHGLGYVGLMASDPAAWRSFATDVLGMMPARALPGESYGMPRVPGSGPASAGSGTGTDGSVYLKMDAHQWRLAVHPGDRAGVAYLGFQLDDDDALDDAVAQIAATGTAIALGTTEEAAARGVRALAWCTDPGDRRVELFVAPVVDGHFTSPYGARFLTGPLGMGHVLLFVSDIEAQLAFYRGVLGLKRTDFFSAGPGRSLHFLRCTPRHHSLGLVAVGPMDGVHHLMFEVDELDAVGAALDRATDAGMTITSTLGRHVNDRMVSFYMRGPDGIEVEVGYDGVLVDDDWTDREAVGGDPWGHRGLAKVVERA